MIHNQRLSLMGFLSTVVFPLYPFLFLDEWIGLYPHTDKIHGQNKNKHTAQGYELFPRH